MPQHGRLGRKPKRFDPRTIQLKHYLLPGAPPAPPAVEYYQKRLGYWGMAKNDVLGDCVLAMCAHLTMFWTASAGEEFIPSDGQVVADYSAITGYDPADSSTDQGTVMLDAYNFWRRPGMMGTALEGYAAVDVQNIPQVKQAIFAFGGISGGFNFPGVAMDQFNAGQPWDIVADDGGIQGGHAVAVLGYDLTYLYCITWGVVQKMTWAFFLKYFDEAAALSSSYWFNKKGLNFEGFGIEQLRQALSLMKKSK
jgi:hypothetical protein